MSLGAKLAIVAATAALTVGLFFVLRSGGDDDAASTTPTAAVSTAQAPTGQGTTTAPGATAPDTTTAPGTTDTTVLSTQPNALIEITVKNGKPVGGVKTSKVKEGDVVALIVTADASDEVRVQGYNLSAAVAPGTPAAMHFTANKAGQFEIVLASRNALLAELSVASS